MIKKKFSFLPTKRSLNRATNHIEEAKYLVPNERKISLLYMSIYVEF